MHFICGSNEYKQRPNVLPITNVEIHWRRSWHILGSTKTKPQYLGECKNAKPFSCGLNVWTFLNFDGCGWHIPLKTKCYKSVYAIYKTFYLWHKWAERKYERITSNVFFLIQTILRTLSKWYCSVGHKHNKIQSV